jgi:hypothetical protein
MTQEPQIIELDDPEKAPRMTAFILLACGLLGVGFLVVNVIFTGEDPYYIESQWEEGEEPVNTRFDVLPNLVRTRQFDDEDEVAENVPLTKPQHQRKGSATGPTNPFQTRQSTGGTQTGTPGPTPPPRTTPAGTPLNPPTPPPTPPGGAPAPK